MFITPPQNQSYEQIFGNFYLVWNEWMIHDWLATAPTESNTMNLRGMVVSLVLDPQVFINANTAQSTTSGVKATQLLNLSNAKFGQAIFNESQSQPARNLHYHMDISPVGVLESDMWTGKRGPQSDQPKSDCWVTVQMYGYHDRIARSSASDVTLLYCDTSGICAGTDLDGNVADLTYGLTGFGTVYNSLDPTPVALNANSGVAPSPRLEWAGRVPTVANNAYVNPAQGGANAPGPVVSVGTPPRLTQAIVGFMFRGTGRLTYEKNYGPTPRHGFIATCEGFIMCMGINVGRI